MIELIQQLNYVLALGGITIFLLATVLIVDLFTSRTLKPIVTSWGLTIALLVTLGGAATALTYSDYFGFVPCGMCWLSRILLFPQILLLLTGIYFKDVFVARYGIVLSLCGLIVSLYHHYLQMGGTEFIKCPVAGEGATCSQRFMFEFDFITFPLMASMSFFFLIVLYTYVLKTRE